MTAAEHFWALLTAIVTVGAMLGMGMIRVGRLLWNVRGSWDATNAKLERLVDKVADLVNDKKADHDRLTAADEKLDRRVSDLERRRDR